MSRLPTGSEAALAWLLWAIGSRSTAVVLTIAILAVPLAEAFVICSILFSP